MGNCLKTQLKSEVNNNNLAKMGEIVVDNNFMSSTNGFVSLYSGENFQIIPVTGGFYATNTWPITEQAYTESTYNYTRGNNCYVRIPVGSEVRITNKYNLNWCLNAKLTADMVNYMALTKAAYIVEDVNRIHLDKRNALNADVGIINTVNTISECFNAFQNATYINVGMCSDLSFTMTQIGQSISFSTISFMLPQNNVRATGAIEDLINAIRTRKTAAGVAVEGTIRINGNLGENSFTFNGNPINGYTSHTYVYDASTITEQ